MHAPLGREVVLFLGIAGVEEDHDGRIGGVGRRDEAAAEYLPDGEKYASLEASISS